MSYPQTKHEPARVGALDLSRPGGQFGRAPGPDAGDGGGHYKVFCGLEHGHSLSQRSGTRVAAPHPQR